MNDNYQQIMHVVQRLFLLLVDSWRHSVYQTYYISFYDRFIWTFCKHRKMMCPLSHKQSFVYLKALKKSAGWNIVQTQIMKISQRWYRIIFIDSLVPKIYLKFFRTNNKKLHQLRMCTSWIKNTLKLDESLIKAWWKLDKILMKAW